MLENLWAESYFLVLGFAVCLGFATTRKERTTSKTKISLKLIDIHFILVLSLNITDFMGAEER